MVWPQSSKDDSHTQTFVLTRTSCVILCMCVQRREDEKCFYQNPFPRSILSDFSLPIFLLVPLLVLNFLTISPSTLFINSLSITWESCGSIFMPISDSSDAAGAVVGSLMQLPIKNQWPPQRKLHKAWQPIKTCFITYAALSFYELARLFEGRLKILGG